MFWQARAQRLRAKLSTDNDNNNNPPRKGKGKAAKAKGKAKAKAQAPAPTAAATKPAAPKPAAKVAKVDPPLRRGAVAAAAEAAAAADDSPRTLLRKHGFGPAPWNGRPEQDIAAVARLFPPDSAAAIAERGPHTEQSVEVRYVEARPLNAVFGSKGKRLHPDRLPDSQRLSARWVSQLRGACAATWKVSRDQINLSYGGRVMRDDETLMNHGISKMTYDPVTMTLQSFTIKTAAVSYRTASRSLCASRGSIYRPIDLTALLLMAFEIHRTKLIWFHSALRRPSRRSRPTSADSPKSRSTA